MLPSFQFYTAAFLRHCTRCTVYNWDNILSKIQNCLLWISRLSDQDLPTVDIEIK